MRVISADALIMKQVSDGVYIVDADAIRNAPTFDAAPVVHGHNNSNSGFLCSACTFGDFGGFHGYKPKYCPNCGAKMDGGKDG